MSDAGVVDPIRVPESIQRLVRGLPRLAQVFIGLTVVDVLGRSIGLVAPRIDFSIDNPASFLAAFIPHDLVILLPAILVIRRPDALRTTPLILIGATAVAVVELFLTPLSFFVSDSSASTIGLSISLSILASTATAGGWLAMGRGLADLNPPVPSPFATGLANLVAIGVALPIVGGVISDVTRPPIDVGDPSTNTAMALGSVFGVVALLASAYLLRSVVRGLDDERRPRRAIQAGVASAAISAVVGLITTIVGVALVIDRNGTATAGFDSALYSISLWLGVAGTTSLLVVAFALGLAEPAVPYEDIASRDTAEA
jgi:hypothetical protein